MKTTVLMKNYLRSIAEFPDGIKETVITSSVPISEILHGLGITLLEFLPTPYELPEEFADIPEIGTSIPDIEVITSIGLNSLSVLIQSRFP